MAEEGQGRLAGEGPPGLVAIDAGQGQGGDVKDQDEGQEQGGEGVGVEQGGVGKGQAQDVGQAGMVKGGPDTPQHQRHKDVGYRLGQGGADVEVDEAVGDDHVGHGGDEAGAAAQDTLDESRTWPARRG